MTLSITGNENDITKVFSSKHYAALCDNSVEAARKYLALFQNKDAAEELVEEANIKEEMVKRLKAKGLTLASTKRSMDTLQRKVAEFKA